MINNDTLVWHLLHEAVSTHAQLMLCSHTHGCQAQHMLIGHFGIHAEFALGY